MFIFFKGNSMKSVLTTRTSNVEYHCNTNEMQEIVTGVYLGTYSVAHCLESLVEKGIRYVQSIIAWTLCIKF